MADQNPSITNPPNTPPTPLNPNPIIPAASYNPQPSIIVQQDNSAFPTGIVLDETNFPLWSQLMDMRIGAQNKIGYLTGKMVKPTLMILATRRELPKITELRVGSLI